MPNAPDILILKLSCSSGKGLWEKPATTGLVEAQAFISGMQGRFARPRRA